LIFGGGEEFPPRLCQSKQATGKGYIFVAPYRDLGYNDFDRTNKKGLFL
jgi:hypothetical protein